MSQDIENNINIYVCTYKDYKNILNDELYIPTGAGASINKFKNKYQLDNDGENISDKNPYYNEFTVLYWIWKNSDKEYVGLIPYRRYFIKYFFSKKELRINDIEKYLKNNDIIVSKRIGFPEGTVEKYHACMHNDNIAYNHFQDLKDTIHELYPEYDEAFVEYMKGNKFYSYNMFISKKKIIDKFCEFLYPILFKIEEKIGLTPYGEHPNKKRIFALLGEILFGVWLTKSNLKIKECYIYRMESKNYVLATIDENFCNRRIGSSITKIRNMIK